jgi:quaternary ammonium compound-resistance protein SugE
VPWIVLVVAGLLEVVWAAALPDAGLSRPLPTLTFLVGLAGSMVLLARATESIPLGTAYAVWVGIGAVGTALVGVAVKGEPMTAGRLGFSLLLVLAIVGLKVTSAH